MKIAGSQLGVIPKPDCNHKWQAVASQFKTRSGIKKYYSYKNYKGCVRCGLILKWEYAKV